MASLPPKPDFAESRPPPDDRYAPRPTPMARPDRYSYSRRDARDVRDRGEHVIYPARSPPPHRSGYRSRADDDSQYRDRESPRDRQRNRDRDRDWERGTNREHGPRMRPWEYNHRQPWPSAQERHSDRVGWNPDEARERRQRSSQDERGRRSIYERESQNDNASYVRERDENDRRSDTQGHRRWETRASASPPRHMAPHLSSQSPKRSGPSNRSYRRSRTRSRSESATGSQSITHSHRRSTGPGSRSSTSHSRSRSRTRSPARLTSHRLPNRNHSDNREESPVSSAKEGHFTGSPGHQIEAESAPVMPSLGESEHIKVEAIEGLQPIATDLSSAMPKTANPVPDAAWLRGNVRSSLPVLDTGVKEEVQEPSLSALAIKSELMDVDAPSQAESRFCDKGKAKEEPPSIDIKMDEVSLSSPRQPRGSASAQSRTHQRSPPRGPRGLIKTPTTPASPASFRPALPVKSEWERRASGASGSGHSYVESTSILDPEVKLPVLFKKEEQPKDLDKFRIITFNLASNISSARNTLMKLNVEYEEAVRVSRRALHELDLATVDLRAAESRRKVAAAQSEKAREGKLGIDAEQSA